MAEELMESLSISSSCSSSSTDTIDSDTDLIITVRPPAPPPPPPPPSVEASNPYVDYLSLITRTAPAGDRNDANTEDVHQFKTAPLFSSAVHKFVQTDPAFSTSSGIIYPQYGLLGMLSGDDSMEVKPHDKLVFSNTEEPHSIFICGSQGSGKSHTLSCLLENTLLKKPEIGYLNTPLSAMVFHYDKFSNFNSGQVCEAAYLCSVGIPVRILVAPTSLNRMTKQYTNLPGVPLGAANPKVMPLYFSQEQLSVDIMMTLMAVHDTGTAAPLYVCAISQILRDIALNYQDRPGFNYKHFRDRLARLELVQGQSAPLNMRLALLESVLLEEQQTEEAKDAYNQIWKFEPGTLTIVDLSDQFVNEQDACALFSICLKLFMDGWKNNPRTIALDEAHKFLNVSTEATQLTSDLIAIVRQQRHLSSRVIIATQEPTVSGALLDLCNITVVHRFNSPQWYSTLRAHLAGANAEDKNKDGIFREVVQLRTGEALVFCPTAVFGVESGKPQPLRDNHLKIQVRDRISADGGQSILPSHQFRAQVDHATFNLSAFRRFDSSSLPAPGSLARKPDLKGSGAASMFGTTSGSVVTSVVSSTSNKRPAPSASTVAQPQKRQTPSTSSPPIAIAACQKYTTAVTEADMQRHMYTAVQRVFNNNRPPSNPVPHVDRILELASMSCGRKKSYLKTFQILNHNKYVNAFEVLKPVLKRYYDVQDVPNSDRHESAWLKK